MCSTIILQANTFGVQPSSNYMLSIVVYNDFGVQEQIGREGSWLCGVQSILWDP